MLSVSDILKLLDQVPIWKSVTGLPKRLAELEARVATLEAGKAEQTAPGPRTCVRCGATMAITEERPSRMGMTLHVMHCDACGHDTTRRYHPKVGYT